MAVPGPLAQNIQEVSRFNPYAPEEDAQDFTNASEGIRSKQYAETLYAKTEVVDKSQLEGLYRKEYAPQGHDTYERPVIVDNSLGVLLSGIAEPIGNAIKLGDALYKKNIQNEVQDQVSSVYDEFGAADLTLLAENAAPPAELQKAKERLTDLAAQRDAGIISDTSFYGKLTAVSKAMKERFPLYEEFVQAAVEEAVGTDPQRALVKSYLSNAPKTESDAERLQKLETRTINEIGMELVAPDYWKRMQDGNPYGFRELQQKVSIYESKQNRINNANAEMDNKVKVAEADRVSFTETANTAVMQKVASIMTGANSAFGDKLEAYVKLNDEIIASGMGADPQEVAKLQQLVVPFINSVKGVVRDELYKFQDNPEGGSYGWSYAEKIGTKGVKEINDSVTMLLENVESALVNQHYGTLKSQAAVFKAIQEDDQMSQYLSSDVIRQLSASRANVGESTVNNVLGSTIEGGKLRTQLGFDLMKLNLLNYGKNRPLARAYDNAWEAGEKNPQFYRKGLEELSEKVVDPNFDPQAKARMVEGTFIEDFSQNFVTEEQARYYKAFGSPEFTTAMGNLRDKGGQAGVDAYASWNDWMLKKFAHLNKSAVHDLKGVVENRPGMFLTYNNTTHEFQNMEIPTKPGQAAVELYGSGFSMLTERMFMEPAADTAVTRINEAIKGILPMLEQSKMDPNQALWGIWQKMGLNLYQEKKPEQYTVFWDYIRGALQQAGQSWAKNASGGQ